MIRENQKLLNQLNTLSDGLLLFLAMPLAFWVRFGLMTDGVISVPLRNYVLLAFPLALVSVVVFSMLGFYSSHRKITLRYELLRLWLVNGFVVAGLLSVLFISRDVHYSRIALAIYFVLAGGLLSCKRIALRLLLRNLRRAGYNLKNILLLGSGKTAQTYLAAIREQKQLGYHAVGYVAAAAGEQMEELEYFGDFDRLASILEKMQLDEVICAVDAQEDSHIPQIIAACEKAGIRLSIIPFYAEYVTAVPQFDRIGDIPLLNIRRIPLENWGNAFCKRLMDIVGSLLLILVSSPVMLVCAIGVYATSPGPILFRQERIGRGNKPFLMYKFRSMKVNNQQDTAWSKDHDDRKTAFGAFLRKFSLDEFPQFFNVLKGDMSLVGPRPEIPHFVKQFREEIPLYMVKHQVRPGITGWAQINGYRGDTSIKARIEHDIYYIEHWSLWLDIKILLITVFKGKFKNSEKLH